MQITHQEARRLIQFHADGGLNPQEQSMLSIHLGDCFECRAYEAEINEVESVLTPVMKRRWGMRPVPLSIDALTGKREPKPAASTLLTMRTAFISFVFAVIVFSAWHFLPAGEQSSGGSPVGIPPVPTPSIQSTSTQIDFEHCAMLL
jgi:anti-sigma factor RsiW